MDRLNAVLFAARYWAARSGIAPSHIPQPFVVVGGPRSGSTLLQKSLDQHKGVQCLHELARENLKQPNFSRYFLGRRRALARLRAQDARVFLQKIFGGQQPKSVRAIGFKALYTQPSRKSGNREYFWSALAEVPNLRVIHLRRNRLERFLSLQLAIKSGGFVGYRYEETPIEIDPEWVLMQMRKDVCLETAAIERLRDTFFMEVNYQALKTNPQVTYKEVFAFLGVSFEPVQAAIQRQRSQKLIDFIENWDAVQDAVLRSEFTHELQTFETTI